MLVGYFNEHGILIYHPASTAAHYLKGPFITDLFGCVALESLESVKKELGKPEKRYYLFNCFQFTRCNYTYYHGASSRILTL